MAVTEHIIKSRDDSFTCECGSGLFHGPWDFIVLSGETVPTCTCAACGRYHLLLRARAEEGSEK